MKLFVKRIGTGPPVVFLHGWGLNHAVWLELAPYLQAKQQLHLVDLPGHGRSEDVADYNLVSITDKIAQQFDYPCTVVAWSFGGMLALRWAAMTTNIQRLILIAGTPQFFQSQDWPHAINTNVLDEFASNLEIDYQHTLKRFLSLQSLGGKETKNNIRRLRQTVLDIGPPSQSALRGCLQILKSANLRPLLDRIRCPVLLLQGEKDILVPAETARVLSRSLMKAKFVIIKQASHAPFLSHQGPFLDELMAFLAERD